MTTATLPDTTSLGAVHLTVTDLDRSIAYYTKRIGFTLHGRSGTVARLGAGGPDLLVLEGRPDARPAGRTAGLYHFAVLVPTRPDLARVLQHLIDTRTPMKGASDHLVSEALYLSDPDGNGIEIYRDRPREEWPFANGQLRMTTDPLDADDLLAQRDDSGAAWTGLRSGTRIGHVHLHVSKLEDAERFYTGVLGFDLVQRYGGSALFVSAGGYHHHVGLNTWAGVGVPPAPADAVGLRHFEVLLPDADALARVLARAREAGAPVNGGPGASEVRDPSGNRVRFAVAAAGAPAGRS